MKRRTEVSDAEYRHRMLEVTANLFDLLDSIDHRPVTLTIYRDEGRIQVDTSYGWDAWTTRFREIDELEPVEREPVAERVH